MIEPLPPGSTIGIVGGGQLGRMLAMAAARLGYRTAILEPDRDCPAAQVANLHIAAAYDDARALERFIQACDVVTYEFENVPVETARTLAERVTVHPAVEALEMAQDRLWEKIFFNSMGIETAPFASVETLQQLEDELRRFGGNGVLKTRRMGYDGKGQCYLREASDEAVKRALESFGDAPLILEGFIAYEREISVIAARGIDGSVAAYDIVENIHHHGILTRSVIPASVASSTAETAREYATEVLSALNYVGVIGIEFFVLPDGRLLANEMAPRVHNSGHWTEAACAISQFEQHIRAISGLPLGDTARHSDCIMENLLGADQERTPELLKQPDLVLHLYGKAKARAGRKVGHFTRLFPRGARKEQ
ncbi:5-(carboxyamino)imidazole ribonucleotide synthase [Chelativorans sp. Marseille-P2723]|uniref:5-(carboxyamino)imidazole ribonucleotide synthase n=1 Tax=Chelativorans sp. Marseille-P2723 TaxID=2709133 RepID=UPI001570FEB2|nr:5-(carboxyamino)imidazole ribonucleotide synthase [Chelativorans sp. Marseille-P2723]